MKFTTKQLVSAAVIATLYAVLTYMQNILLPGTTSAAIQFRASEALMMLCLFSPTAIAGLTIGCAVSNIISGMPLDVIIGSAATLLAGLLIYGTREIKIKGFPLLSVLWPAVCNGIIVGAEIQFYYIGGFSWISFLIQAGCVAVGELAVSAVLGTPLFYAFKKSNIQNHI